MEESTIPPVEVSALLLATAVLCGLICLERETGPRASGCTSSSAYGFPGFTDAALQSNGRGVQLDPTRRAAQMVTGVGFWERVNRPRKLFSKAGGFTSRAAPTTKNSAESGREAAC